ncbi:hypothetical protein CYB75_08755, partial [Campylobacter coli]|nr:hypothetical protein [Campylobacter coli]
MRILKILYICWIIFFIFAWIISPLIGHNPDILIVIGWIILPPIVVNLWLFLITRIKKYLIRFLLLLLYCSLAIL